MASVGAAAEGKLLGAIGAGGASGHSPDGFGSTATTAAPLGSTIGLSSPRRDAVGETDPGNHEASTMEFENNFEIEMPIVQALLPDNSEFLRELATLASNDVKRLLRYTVKNTMCCVEGYKDDSEERATKNCEQALACFFEKLHDYVEFAVNRVDQVSKTGVSYAGVPSSMTSTIMQRQLRRAIDHAKELSTSLEAAEQKEHDLEKKFRDMRRMYYTEVLNLRQRCTRLQRQVINDLPYEADLETVQVDDDVSYWSEKSFVEPWVKDLLANQANELKARASIQEQKMMMQIERQKEQLDHAAQKQAALEDQLANVKSKVKYTQMRLAVQAVTQASHDASILREEDTAYHSSDGHDGDGSDRTPAMTPSASSARSYGGAAAAARRRRAQLLESPDQQSRIQALQYVVDDGTAKLQTLQELHAHWDQRLKESDEEMSKDVSKTMLAQLQARVDKIHSDFAPLRSGVNGDLPKIDSSYQDPWMMATESETRATKLENEVTLLQLDKQHLQKMLLQEKEEPQKQRKQLRALTMQLEQKDQTIAQSDKKLEASHKEQERMQIKISGLTKRLEQLEEQIGRSKARHSQDHHTFGHASTEEVQENKKAGKTPKASEQGKPERKTSVGKVGDQGDQGEQKTAQESNSEEAPHEETTQSETEALKKDSLKSEKSPRTPSKRGRKLQGQKSSLKLGLDDDAGFTEEEPMKKTLSAPQPLNNDGNTGEAQMATETNAFQEAVPEERQESKESQEFGDGSLTSTTAEPGPTPVGARLRTSVMKARRRASFADVDEIKKSVFATNTDEVLGLNITPSSASDASRSPAMIKQGTGIPKTQHARLLKTAVERERLRWQTMLPRTRSEGTLTSALRGKTPKTLEDKQAVDFESLLTAAEDEADFQRYSALFESLAGGRLSEHLRRTGTKPVPEAAASADYFRVMGMLQKVRNAFRAFSEQHTAAVLSADAGALEKAELRDLYQAAEVRGRLAWELQRQALLTCQKALAQSGQLSGLAIDPALVDRSPAQALAMLAHDVNNQAVTKVSRRLKYTRTKAERVVRLRAANVSKNALDDALALVPQQLRLGEQLVDPVLELMTKAQADQAPKSDQPGSPPQAAAANLVQKSDPDGKDVEASASATSKGGVSATPSGDASALPASPASKGGVLESPSGGVSATPSEHKQSKGLAGPLAALAEIRMKGLSRYRHNLQRAAELEDDATATRVVSQLQEIAAAEASTTASEEDSSDEALSSDDEIFSRARHAVWHELQHDTLEQEDEDAKCRSPGELKEMEALPPLHAAVEDHLTRCDMPSVDRPVPLCSPLAEHHQVLEVEQVTRQRREVVERSAEVRFRRMRAKVTDKVERNISQEHYHRGSVTTPSSFMALQWTPPRTPSPDGHQSALSIRVGHDHAGHEEAGQEDDSIKAAKSEKLESLIRTITSPNLRLDDDSIELMEVLANDLQEEAEGRAAKEADANNQARLPAALLSPDAEDTKNERPASAMISPRSTNLLASPAGTHGKRVLSARGPRPGSARADRLPQNRGSYNISRSQTPDHLHDVADVVQASEAEVAGPPEKPKSGVEKIIASMLKVLKNETGNSRVQEMVGELSAETRMSLCSGFVETFVSEHQAQATAENKQYKESQDEVASKLSSWGVPAPKPRMMDKEVQFSKEERITLKEHATQTEAVLSERDEATRRINVREAALKALTDRLLLTGGAEFATIGGQLQGAAPHHEAITGSERKSQLPVPHRPPVTRSTSEGDLFAPKRGSSGRHEAIEEVTSDQRVRGLSGLRRASSASKIAIIDPNADQGGDRDDAARLAANMLLVPGASTASGATGAGTGRGDYIVGRMRGRADVQTAVQTGGLLSGPDGRRSTTCNIPILDELLGKVHNPGSRCSSRRNTQYERGALTPGLQRLGRDSRVASSRQSVIEVHKPADSPQTSAMVPKASDRPNTRPQSARSLEMAKHESLGATDAEQEHNVKDSESPAGTSSSSDDSEASEDNSGDRDSDVGSPSSKAAPQAGGDFLEQMLESFVTEVVDFAQCTDLMWDSIPGRVITWLKYNLMQRQQAILYNSSWTTSELDDFPTIGILDREQLMKEFEFFLFHVMSLERPGRATDQRRALRKQYREACVGDAMDKPAEPLKDAEKMPHVNVEVQAPPGIEGKATPLIITSLADVSTELSDTSLMKWSSLGTLSSASVGIPQMDMTKRKSGMAFPKTGSKPTIQSNSIPSELAIDTRIQLPRNTPDEQGELYVSDDGSMRIETDGGDTQHTQSVSTLPIDAQGGEIVRRHLVNGDAPPAGLSRQQLAAHHLGTLLGFDVSATGILDVQQDMYCQDYFREQEGLAHTIGIEPFPLPDQGRDNASQSQFPALLINVDSPEPQQTEVNVVDVGVSTGPFPFDSQVLDTGQERAVSAGLTGPRQARPNALLPEQSLRPSTAPEPGPSGQIHAEAVQQARRVRLLAQRLEAVRPYHWGPIPATVVQQLRQLEMADVNLSEHFGGLAGNTSEDRRRLMECLDPLYQRIRIAVTQSYFPQGIPRRPGTDDLSSVDSELSRQLASDERDLDRIHAALEGLCSSTAKRESMRKALLRFAFHKLRNFDPTVQEADSNQVRDSPWTRATLRGIAHQDIVGRTTSSRSGAQDRPGLAPAQKPPLRPLEAPPAQEFIGAVSWSYKAEARSLVAPSPAATSSTPRGAGRISASPRVGSGAVSKHALPRLSVPRLSADWSARPGTAPEVGGNANMEMLFAEPLPEPPPGYDSSETPRPDTAPVSMLPGVPGTAPSVTRQITGGERTSPASPRANRPPWPRRRDGQTPRDQAEGQREGLLKQRQALPPPMLDSIGDPDPTSGASSVRQRVEIVGTPLAAATDNPAAATPTTTSLFARALSRGTPRGKIGQGTPTAGTASTPSGRKFVASPNAAVAAARRLQGR